MAYLIDKDALVAEITHKIKVLEAFIKNFDGISDKVEKAKNKIEALGDVLLSIENLEVKEVDLDFQMFAKEMDAIFTLPSSETKNTEEEPLNWEYAIAKHFFELGLKSKSSYLSTPNIDDTLKEMGVDPDSKSAKSFKEFYYMALEKFKAQKGEEV